MHDWDAFLDKMCPGCGAVVRDTEQHKRFHDSILALIKQAYGVDDNAWAELTNRVQEAIDNGQRQWLET